MTSAVDGMCRYDSCGGISLFFWSWTMTRLPAAALVAALTLALGCQAVELPPEPVDQGACGDVWGPVPADGRIYVDAAAEAGGDGSLEAPFDALLADGVEVDSGLEAARSSGTRSVVLAPGEYAGHHVLSQDVPEWQDSGLEIAGCGADLTELVAVTDEDGVLLPVVEVVGASTADVVVRDLALLDGRRSLLVRAGAGREGPIVAERVRVADSTRLGVLVLGPETVVNLLDVDVEGVQTEGGSFGWGIFFQIEAPLLHELAAPNVVEGCDVSGAFGAGIAASGAWLDVAATTVSDTQPLDGLLGRGVMYQDRSWGTIDSVTLAGNADAALFLHKPGRDGQPVEVIDCTLRDTAEAEVPATGAPTGDGLVITQADAGQQASTFPVVVDGTTFEGNPRAHLLAEGVLVQVGPDNVFGKGTDFPFAAQGGALAEGIDGGAPPEEPIELGDDEALGINDLPLGLDAPEE
jgi:hypothetical protein